MMAEVWKPYAATDICKVGKMADIKRQKMNIVIAGHVDHGKSTIIGRLLADTHSLPDGKLEGIREMCERNSKPFEYAFLLDALKDEQSQGITIDVARVFFKTKKRDYIIIDAPGHIEFLKNMVTGASRAEAALLVIDAAEGVQENSRRHGYMFAMLGIKQVAIIVNKMDLVDYDQKTYDDIVEEYSKFLVDIDMKPECFVPVSGMEGDNIASLSERMKWYKGYTVLDVLDNFRKEEESLDKAFRMPVQDVYKFTKYGDSRRIVAGTIDSGVLSVGDKVIFYPSGKSSRVKEFPAFNADISNKMSAGAAIGFTLDQQIYITRGELATKEGDLRPEVTSRFRVSLFWLGKKIMTKDKEYLLKVGTAKVPVRIEEIVRVIDASNLTSSDTKTQIDRHDVAECIFRTSKAVAFDTAENISQTSRFVVIDDYEICGGGIIREGLSDEQSDIRDKILMRNYKWVKSNISPEQRAERYNQKPSVIVITGEEDTGKKKLARELEEKLFGNGEIAYFLGIGNVKYGVDADIAETGSHDEHIRRLAEVANIMLDAGMILITTAVELEKADMEIFKMSVNPDNICTVWIGDKVTTDIEYNLYIKSDENFDKASNRIIELLKDKGFIFRV